MIRTKAVGFTGTREGMSKKQKEKLAGILRTLAEKGYGWFHHGDCVGADAESQSVAMQMKFSICTHPPEDDKYRAFREADATCEPKPYIERNHDIVDACLVLIAAPKGPEEQRSGTWATVRYARTQNKKIIMLER